MDFLSPPQFPSVSSPGTPDDDALLAAFQRIVASGGLVLPRWRGEDNTYWSTQPHLGRNAIAVGQAQGGITTAMNVQGWSNFSTTGTATARSVATTNYFTRQRRLGYVGGATAGQAAGFFTTNVATHHHFTMGGVQGSGFLHFWRFGCADAATVASAHQFCGVNATSSTPSVTGNPNAYTNAIGLAQCNGSSNLQIVYGGSAAQTPIDLGSNFPAGTSSVDWYEFILFCSPAYNNKAVYRVERMNTGDVASGILTAATPGTQLPANTQLLGPRCWRSNNATAAAVALDIGGFEFISGLN